MKIKKVFVLSVFSMMLAALTAGFGRALPVNAEETWGGQLPTEESENIVDMMEISDAQPSAEEPQPLTLTREGFAFENGKYYYYEHDQRITNAEKLVDGYWYYFGADGAMALGWTKQNNNNNIYYYDANGHMVHGLYSIEGKTYGFDEWSGALLTGEHLFQDNINNNWYYFYENNDAHGHKKGEMATGWIEHHNNQYYYDASGIMAHHIAVINGKSYGFNEWTGVLLTGEHYFTDGSDDNWYYFSEEAATRGQMAVGWTEHHGNKYYYDAKGRMVHGPYEIDGKCYLFDEWLGTVRTGWVPYHNEWYCMDENGVMYRGEYFLDGHWYYFDEITGITANKGFAYHHDHWYYYNDYGYMQYGELSSGGEWYYFDPWTGVMATGWREHHGNTYYYASDGHMVHGTCEIDGREYYFDEVTGVLKGKERLYQNPEQYYQIQDKISLSGGGFELSVGYEGLKVAYVMRALGMGQGIGMPANGGAYYSFTVSSKVSSFQKKKGLNATGNVDLKTWKAMGYSEYDWYYLDAYVSPMKINVDSTRSDCIEAMISTAYSYLGTSYIVGAAGAPGTGVDCSGLVMQSLYAAGLDLSPINPIRHASPGYEYESRNMYASSRFKSVPYSERQRGDLIFYCNSSGTIIHVAIYLGNDQVIESWPNQVVVWPIVNGQRANIAGVRRPFV